LRYDAIFCLHFPGLIGNHPELILIQSNDLDRWWGSGGIFSSDPILWVKLFDWILLSQKEILIGSPKPKTPGFYGYIGGRVFIWWFWNFVLVFGWTRPYNVDSGVGFISVGWIGFVGLCWNRSIKMKTTIRQVIFMQSTLNLDETLVREALQLTKLTTQDELIDLALKELVQSRKKKNLFELAGQIQFAPNFDHKVLREINRDIDWYLCNDRDFEAIAQVSSLQHLRFQFK
jgi:Arc/MetJ family transcription regulator